MDAAIAMKACSTLVAFLALVSMNGMPISSANAWMVFLIIYRYPKKSQGSGEK